MPDVGDIPVVDLFAGPGGLGEGFSSFKFRRKTRFRIVLSVEKDGYAHSTLRLRSFTRKLPHDSLGEILGDFVRSKRRLQDIEQLYDAYPDLIAEVDDEVLADRNDSERELGSRLFPARELDAIIRDRLAGASTWALIGGPPCQAYSMVGRAKLKSLMGKGFEKDRRHFLYKQYLRIIATHRPPIFVMENVKGMLSSTIGGKRIVEQILSDLRKPMQSGGLSYRLFPFVRSETERFFEDDTDYKASDFVIRSEDFGVPQKRHRVIILGIRSDIGVSPQQLVPSEERVDLERIIADLPPLQSIITGSKQNDFSWAEGIRKILKLLDDDCTPSPVLDVIHEQLKFLHEEARGYSSFVSYGRGRPNDLVKELYRTRDLGGVCNHEPRRHMLSDLHRYFYSACYAQAGMNEGRMVSPKLRDFPDSLLPNHENIDRKSLATAAFADRFRVQVWDEPATTVTSHICKDGHYFIHPDPTQCRSLSVREAARIQTFPDDYIFLGTRTAQYHQVGNAVPPLLAEKLAGVVYGVLNSVNKHG